MDEQILTNLNKKVKEKDTLYFLGDFGWGRIESVKKYRKRIRCQNIHLILGNHNKHIRKRPQDFSGNSSGDSSGDFRSISEIKEIKIGEQFITLCHYAMRAWSRKHYGAWNLHGHSHNTLEKYPQSLDVGIDGNNFYPYNWQDIVNLLEGEVL